MEVARTVARGTDTGGGDDPDQISERGATPMRSKAQREASRTNGAKSKGPTSPEGKDKVKFNGLKHGLRAEQVVLPGEDRAEFEAELKGWADDWKPAGHTRAVLVERAAVASWRLRRCVRAEADLVLGLAAEGAGGERGDDDIGARIELAEESLHHEPAEAARELRSFSEGVDRLISGWGELDEALDDGAEAWERYHHGCAMRMLGHGSAGDPAGAGPPAADSARLAVANDRRIKEEGRDGLLPEPEASEMVARLQLRDTIKDLVALDKARPDLGEGEGDAPEAPAPPAAAPESPGGPKSKAAPGESEPATGPKPDAPSEPEPGAVPAPSDPSRRDREARTWPVGGPGGPGSSSWNQSR